MSGLAGDTRRVGPPTRAATRCQRWLLPRYRGSARLAVRVVGADANQEVVRAHGFSGQQPQTEFWQRRNGLPAAFARSLRGLFQRLRLRWIQMHLGRLIAHALAVALDTI